MAVISLEEDLGWCQTLLGHVCVLAESVSTQSLEEGGSGVKLDSVKDKFFVCWTANRTQLQG